MSQIKAREHQKIIEEEAREQEGQVGTRNLFPNPRSWDGGSSFEGVAQSDFLFP
jgi:hypothetical protein